MKKSILLAVVTLLPNLGFAVPLVCDISARMDTCTQKDYVQAYGNKLIQDATDLYKFGQYDDAYQKVAELFSSSRSFAGLQTGILQSGYLGTELASKAVNLTAMILWEMRDYEQLTKLIETFHVGDTKTLWKCRVALSEGKLDQSSACFNALGEINRSLRDARESLITTILRDGESWR